MYIFACYSPISPGPATAETSYAMTQDIRTGICSLPREIISLICWNVAPGKYHGTAPGNLLSLARSCRFLSEPALDIIWNTLPSIWPLLLLLPEDLCEFRHIEGLDPEDPQTEFEYVQRFRYGRTKLVSTLNWR